VYLLNNEDYEVLDFEEVASEGLDFDEVAYEGHL